MSIRDETQSDRDAVYALNASAFDTAAEARLVDALREQAAPVVSLVAEQDGSIVGHILFSPVTLSGHENLKIMGLAPMAVAPSRQRQGIGSSLVRAGLDRCRALGADAVVVLGHPAFYPRFGFYSAGLHWAASQRIALQVSYEEVDLDIAAAKVGLVFRF